MEYNEFKNFLKAQMEERFPESEVNLETVTKKWS